MTLEQLYHINCQQPSAINHHLPTLHKYAFQCKHIIEMGVESGLSTSAFLVAQPDYLISYDIKMDLRLVELMCLGELYHVYSTDAKFTYNRTIWWYTLMNSLHVQIAPTDLLFIDTLHTYLQLKEELHLHNDKVKKWIILHDTESFGEFSEGWQDIPNPAIEQKQGINAAVKEFLTVHPEWQIKEHFTINNGLTVLERR